MISITQVFNFWVGVSHELKDAMQDGKLSAREIINLIEAVAKSLDVDLDELTIDVDALLNKLNR